MVLRLVSTVTNPMSSYPLADEHAHTQVSSIGQLHKSHQVLIVHHRVYKSEVKGSEPVNQEVHLISHLLNEESEEKISNSFAECTQGHIYIFSSSDYKVTIDGDTQ